jgi:hypothetical protein
MVVVLLFGGAGGAGGADNAVDDHGTVRYYVYSAIYHSVMLVERAL